MKKTLREAIREEIKKLLLEDYETGDLAIDNYKDVFSKKKVIKKVKTQPPSDTKRNKKTKKSNTKKLKSTPEGDLDVDVMVPQDQEDVGNYMYTDNQIAIIEEVKKYYQKKYTSGFDNKTLTIDESPDISNHISEYDQVIYDKAYNTGKQKVNSALAALDGNKDDHTKNAIETASAAMGVSKQLLYFLMSFESGGSTYYRDGCNKFGYCGLFQFGDSAAETTGFVKADLYSRSARYDKILNNAIATTRLAKAESGKGIASQLGGDSFLSIWLNHNQGAAGSLSVYNKRNDEDKVKNKRYTKNNVSGKNSPTFKEWLTAWWGHCAGAEDAINEAALPKGEIMLPSSPENTTTQNNTSQSSPGSSPESSPGQKLADKWIDNLGSNDSLGKYPNLDHVWSETGYQEGNYNYRAGIDQSKYDHDKEFFERLKFGLAIDNIVTLGYNMDNVVNAAKDAGLNVTHYKIGKPHELNRQQLEKIFDLLDNGNTLVHCTHGADRTGGVIGRYYVERGIMNAEDAKADHDAHQGSGKDVKIRSANRYFIEHGTAPPSDNYVEEDYK